MKTCADCGEHKPLTEYYRSRPTNTRKRCKPCHKALAKRTRDANLEVFRARERASDRRNPKTINRALSIIRTRKWVANNPVKHAAHKAVLRAVRNGTLVKQPCATCGTAHRVHGHHEDYTKQLDVIWLCPQCHSDVHRKARGHVSARS